MKHLIEPYLRKASVAAFTEWNEKSEVTSYATHVTLLGKDEEWPRYQGLRMFPLLQVITSELPFVPEILKPYQAITVFVKSELVDGELHCSYPYYCDEFDDQYEIRAYTSLDEVQVVDVHEKFETYPKTIQWKLIENDAPDYDGLLGTLEENVDLKALYQTLRKAYNTDRGFKVGGYPCLWQDSFEGVEAFCIQLGTLEGECLWGDEGNAYIMQDEEGGFYLEWQSS